MSTGRVVASGTAGVIIVSAGILLTWHLTGVPSGRCQPSQAAARQITSDASWEGEPRLSPDESMVAYSSDRSGNPDIWISDIRGGTPLRLTDDPTEDTRPVWFPDGQALAFNSTRGGRNGIWKVPRLGGAAVMLVPDASDAAISPDGRHLAFAKANSAGRFRIHIAPMSDVTHARAITDADDGLWFHYNPVWSPDGTVVCYQAWRSIWVVPADGGAARRLTEDEVDSTWPTWSPDGRFIYFSSNRSGTRALWRVPADGGAADRVTLGTGPEWEPSVGAGGRLLVYSNHLSNGNILLFDRSTGAQVPIGGVRGDWEPAFSPDGSQLIYVSDRDGRKEIWAQPLAAGLPQGSAFRLTDQAGGFSSPAISPDGRWIAFYRLTDGQRDVWIMPAAGGPPARATHDAANDIHPAWSPDGSLIAFSSERSGQFDIWVSSVADGQLTNAHRVTTNPCTDWFPDWAPDGSAIAFVRVCGYEADAWTVRVDGDNDERKVTSLGNVAYVAWDRSTGQLLIRAARTPGLAEIFRVDPKTGQPTNLEPALRFPDHAGRGSFAVSRDGRLLAAMAEEVGGDIWVLEAPPGTYW